MEVVSVPLIHPRALQKISITSPSIDLHRESDDTIPVIELDSVSETSVESFPFTVPPSTPAPNFSFIHPVELIKQPFPKFDNLKIPYVREVGIKAAIDTFSEYFSLPDYKFNEIQFWFLDVITDCAWKMQDEYQFPEHYQKVILEWLLYVFELIRDPQRNLSRKEFFRIFNEALMIADERVQAGCEMLPAPADLFILAEAAEEEEISFPSESRQNSSVSLMTGGASYIAIGIDESTEIFELPEARQKRYEQNGVTNTTTTTTSSEYSTCGCEEYTPDFYQADPNTPPRFRSTSSSSIDSIHEELDSLPPPTGQRLLWKQSSITTTNRSCSEEKHMNTESQESPLNSEGNTDQPDYIKQHWADYLNDRTELIEQIEKNVMINSCALSAIKEFVYDYFSETFQFTVIRLALINSFTTITQRINKEWKIPKILKEELKKPKPVKEKKTKKKKDKKPHKKTKDKKKKPKERKTPKKAKKEKKPKKHKPTKEEKAELARLKREQERLEEEQRIAEENRKLLFPLKDATNDDFFKSIFQQWVKPKQDTKKKGKKKK